MKVKHRKITELIPAEYNPRYITPEALEQLKASIQRFDAVEPVLVNMHPDRKNIIISGHQRIKAAKSLGMDKFPCVELNLDKEQEKELNVRMNKNTGAWDWDELSVHFEVEDLTDWGFTEEELFGNIEEEELEAEEDEYEQPDEIETDIVLGDLIEIGRHRLLCGDSTETDNWHKLIGERLFDIVITDPPYNVSYVGKTKDALTIKNDTQSNDSFYQFLYDFYTALSSYTVAGGAWYVFHADSEGENFRKAFRESNLLLKQCLIWNKNTMVMGRQDYHWKHEPILYGWKEGAAHNWYTDRKQVTVLDFDRPSSSKEHPTMKPIPIISYFLNNSSKKNDIVGDGFLGSGSTMVASHQLNRTCYGMELDPKYCQVIIDRMQQLDPSLEIKVNGEPYGV